MAEFEMRLAFVNIADGTIARGYMIERCELQGRSPGPISPARSAAA